jgi:hypothetical protein
MSGTSKRLAARSPFSDAVVLAALSGFTYLEAYIFEKAFADVFGIPSELIDIRWATIFAAGSGVLLAAAAMMALFLVIKRRPAAGVWHRTAWALLLGAAVTLPAAFVLGLARWREFVALYIVATLGGVLFTLVKSDRDATKRSKVGESEPEKKEKGGDHGVVVAGFRFSVWAIYGAALLVNALLFAFWLGEANAENMREFMVMPSPRPQAVLRIYGDKIVTAELDRPTRTLNPIYHILPVIDTGRVFIIERLSGVVLPCRPYGIPESSLAGIIGKMAHFLEYDPPPDAIARTGRCGHFRNQLDSAARATVYGPRPPVSSNSPAKTP